MKKLHSLACLRYSSFHLFPLTFFSFFWHSQIIVTHVSLERSEMFINDSKWSLLTVTTSNLALSKSILTLAHTEHHFLSASKSTLKPSSFIQFPQLSWLLKKYNLLMTLPMTRHPVSVFSETALQLPGFLVITHNNPV